MTLENTLPSAKYGEIAARMYLEDPLIEEILDIVTKHVKEQHFPDSETLLDLDILTSQIEHLDAVLKGRRTLEELA